MKTKVCLLFVGLASLMLLASPARAGQASDASTSHTIKSSDNTAENTYPAKPITILVPWGVNSDGDTAARSLAKHVAPYLGNPEFIIENLEGKSGSTATIKAQNAAADGYTLLLGRVGSHIIAPAMDPDLPYRWDQFTFLGLLEFNPQIFAVRSDLPYKDIRELTQFLRSNPGVLKFGSTGIGTIPYLSTQYLFKLSGLQPDAAQNVTLSGGGKVATEALLSGQIDFICTPASQPLLESSKSGKIRPLFTTMPGRIPDFPQLNNASEAGLRDLSNMSSWALIAGPKQLPGPVVARWKEALKRLAVDKEWLSDVAKRGSVAALGTIKDNEGFIKNQYDQFEQLIRSLNLQKKPADQQSSAPSALPK